LEVRKGGSQEIKKESRRAKKSEPLLEKTSSKWG